jgi:hypothetical protein
MAAPDESDTDALLRRKAEELQTLQQQWRKNEKPEHDDDDHDDDEEESIPHKEQRILVQASGKIAVGSTVRIAGQTTMGKVAKLNGNGTALLAMGNLYITAPIAKLEILKIES